MRLATIGVTTGAAIPTNSETPVKLLEFANQTLPAPSMAIPPKVWSVPAAVKGEPETAAYTQSGLGRGEGEASGFALWSHSSQNRDEWSTQIAGGTTDVSESRHGAPAGSHWEIRRLCWLWPFLRGHRPGVGRRRARPAGAGRGRRRAAFLLRERACLSRFRTGERPAG